MSNGIDEVPSVNVVVQKDGDSVVLRFDKNIGMLRMDAKTAAKMGDMMKLEAVRVMRNR